MNDDTYPNAGRASGYKDERGNDIGENIINRVTEMLAAPQTKLVLLADQMSALAEQFNALMTQQSAIVKVQNQQAGQQDDIVKTQNQRFEYVLSEFKASLAKEDQRHKVYDESEKTTQAALTDAVRMLDEITSYVQQSVTLAREGITIGKEALVIAKATDARLGKLDEDVTRVKQDLISLKEGQVRISNEVKQLRDDHDARLIVLEARLAAAPSLEEAREFYELLRQIQAERGGHGI